MMMQSMKRNTLAVAAVAALMGLSACGGGEKAAAPAASSDASAPAASAGMGTLAAPLVLSRAAALAQTKTDATDMRVCPLETRSLKLGSFRMNGMPQESRGQALALAASLAGNDDQRREVRRVVYALLGEKADYWPTIALQRLGDTVNDDLAFLSMQGWAIRSLVALKWVEHGEPEHLGIRLARDSDARVRRALAHALADQADEAHADVRAVLADDPACSVRTALSGADAP